MEAKITSSNCEVINSGLVTSFEGKPIDISLLDSTNSEYHIVFEFIEDESTKEHQLLARTRSDGITFLLTNFANPIGTGTIKPIPFARDGRGRNLYVNFYVHSVGKSNPTLQYTIYREIQGGDNVQ